MEKQTKITYLLFGLVVLSYIIYIALYVLFRSPISFILVFPFAFGFAISVVQNTINYIRKGEPRDLYKLGWIGLFGLIGLIPGYNTGLLGFFGFFGFFGTKGWKDMEETTQQNIQKSSIPTKTRVVADLLIIFGILVTSASVLAFPSAFMCPACPSALIFIIPGFLAGLSGVIFGILLFKRKKLGWWLSAVYLIGLLILVLSLVFIYSYQRYLIVLIALVIIPLILLLLDRKNFWKITS